MRPVLVSGPRSVDDRWPLLQRVRWRFVLLNLVVAATAALNLGRVGEEPGGRPTLYVLASAAMALWAVTLYRSGGRNRLLDPFGPLLVAAIGAAGGHHRWAIGPMFVALFLHSLYGSRARVWRNAISFAVAYQVTVGLAIGWGEVLSDQLMPSSVMAVFMAWLMAQMGSSHRSSDEQRGREAVLLAINRRLLGARDPAAVAREAADGAAEFVARTDAGFLRATVWRRGRDELELAASTGDAAASDRLAPAALSTEELSGDGGPRPVRLPSGWARAVGWDAAGVAAHGLALPLSDGDDTSGSILVETDRPLPDEVVDELQRFALEVCLADQAVRGRQLLQGVVDNSPDGILLADRDGRLAYVSPAVTELARRPIPDGAPIGLLLAVGDDQRPVRELAELAEAAGSLVVPRPDGTVVEVEVSSRAVPGEGTVLNVRDVSAQRQLQREITYRALHDQVTDLPNRTLFLDRLRQALSRAARAGTTVAVGMLDLDDFKSVNDTFGHLTGDRLLCHVADQLRAHVRSSDTVARLGGDEFTLLLEDIGTVADAETRAEALLAALSRPLELDGHRIAAGASLGIVLSRGEHTDEEALTEADRAMYRAKTSGKGRLEVHDPLTARPDPPTLNTAR